jgi:enoyl-[acyl-carrier protein] reductase II
VFISTTESRVPPSVKEMIVQANGLDLQLFPSIPIRRPRKPPISAAMVSLLAPDLSNATSLAANLPHREPRAAIGERDDRAS